MRSTRGRCESSPLCRRTSDLTAEAHTLGVKAGKQGLLPTMGGLRSGKPSLGANLLSKLLL